MTGVAVWLAAAAGVLVSLWTIGHYLRKFGRFAVKVAAAFAELAKLPAAVQQLGDALHELAGTTTARLDAHDRELARLSTFHPQEMNA